MYLRGGRTDAASGPGDMESEDDEAEDASGGEVRGGAAESRAASPQRSETVLGSGAGWRGSRRLEGGILYHVKDVSMRRSRTGVRDRTRSECGDGESAKRRREPWRELRGGGRRSLMFVLDVLVLREAMAYCSELTDDTSVCNVARRSATNTSDRTETHYQVQHEMCQEADQSTT